MPFQNHHFPRGKKRVKEWFDTLGKAMKRFNTAGESKITLQQQITCNQGYCYRNYQKGTVTIKVKIKVGYANALNVIGRCRPLCHFV